MIQYPNPIRKEGKAIKSYQGKISFSVLAYTKKEAHAQIKKAIDMARGQWVHFEFDTIMKR